MANEGNGAAFPLYRIESRAMAETFIQDGVAVITGGASGIGRAAVRKAAAAGMKIAFVDVNAEKLAVLRAEIGQAIGADRVLAEIVDVADFASMEALARVVEARWGAPTLLMNNAAGGVAGGAGGILDPHENWQRLLAVNLFGPINGVQAFLPGMLAAGRRAMIVNTGSKQGLTNPPGNPAYNTSKAAVNAYTQNLARDLRERPGGLISAHLLIPGWTTTGEAEHRPGAWLPEQVIDYMAEAVRRDAFFILCPDDETPAETDHKRILWNAFDIVLDRPALSRWHPDYKEEFAAFMGKDLPKAFD
jgi:NAD(P)-dependent dehydrogenase (short-subunit alcohol dehydrogenase family)